MYFPLLLNEFQATRATTAWIGSLNNGVYMLAGCDIFLKLLTIDIYKVRSNLIQMSFIHYRSNSHNIYQADWMSMDCYGGWLTIYDRVRFE